MKTYSIHASGSEHLGNYGWKLSGPYTSLTAAYRMRPEGRNSVMVCKDDQHEDYISMTELTDWAFAFKVSPSKSLTDADLCKGWLERNRAVMAGVVQ